METLPYVEDEDAYRVFVRKLETKTRRKEESHITIDTSNDKEEEKKRVSSTDETSSEETENPDGEYEDYTGNDEDIQYYDPQEDYNSGYDENEDVDYYDYGYDQEVYDADDF